ncbi:MAG: NUMOD3 domain-containing DNA-binding protein [Bacteriovoracales bacterium]
MKVYGYIYKIINWINGNHYVGQAEDMYDRMKSHRSSFRDKSKQTYLIRAVKKHGTENFFYVILDTALSEEELDLKEKLYIKKFGKIYNMTDGGEGSRGFKHSKETKLKMAKISSEKKHSEETKKLLSELKLLNNPFKGKKHSDESKKKMSIANKKSYLDPNRKPGMKGKNHSEEAKQKMSKDRKGIKKTPEHRKKIGEAHKGVKKSPQAIENNRKAQIGLQAGPLNPMYGRNHSEETKEKIRLKKLGGTQSPESNLKRSITLRKINFQKRYPELFSWDKEIPPVINIQNNEKPFMIT